LTDVIMPGMNGRDLADELMSRIPRLKCLFMSGYTSDILSNHGVMNKDLQFLPKPFSRGALARKIRETLGTTATA
jgi:FixJ family two-component response regulator